MKKVLLCPPAYYDIEYEINPWMDLNNKVDHDKVNEEYLKLKQIYSELNIEILEIQPEKGLPDMVYAANFGSIADNVFIKSNFKFEERKKEASLAKNYFQKLGLHIEELPEGIIWEGQGDLLKAGNTYFLGWGKRTELQAKKVLEEILHTEIIDLKLVDKYYYHLDTCFLPIDEKTVAFNSLSFEEQDIIKIANHFPNIIEVEQADNDILACNAIVEGKTIVCGQGISQKLKGEYAKYGYEVKEVPMEEYRKGGGSVKCLTLEFY